MSFLDWPRLAHRPERGERLVIREWEIIIAGLAPTRVSCG